MSRITVCMVIVAMLVSMGVALAQEGLEGTCWYDRMCIMGYFDARYLMYEDSSRDDAFDFRRMYVTIKGDVNDRTTGIITLSRVGGQGPNIDLYNAFVDYKVGDQWAVQVGQVPTWFGLEAWEGSPARLPLERARILEGAAAGGVEGFWWQGAPDRGLWLRRNPAGSEPLVIIGVCNGQFREGEMNPDKNISLDLKWARDWGMFGASWFDGKFSRMEGDPAVEVKTDRNAVAAYVRYFPNPWGLQAEWADGELLGRDRNGYYLQGMYKTDTGTAFARWEEYTAKAPNMIDVDQVGVGDTDYDALHLGYVWVLDEANEITAEYVDATRTAGPVHERMDYGDSYGGVQWRFAFK